MKEEKKNRWEEVITSINLTHNSRKAWQTIKKLYNDPTSPNPPCLVNSNQVAHHLLVNGQGTMPTKPKCPALPTVEGTPSLVSAFSEEEYRKGIAALKNNKEAGIDDILVEQLKNLGPKAHKWLHTMLNTCFIENKIPKTRRQSKIIAILKPGKDSAIPKNYRPISLLCHTYKLYERLILNRVSPLLEQHLIKKQAGFRPGKSCTSQLLILTQHIEDGYQRGMITGAAFVDLSAAYDTVNHRILIQKLYNTTQDSKLCRVFQNMLSNRRLYVELNNERSRWRKQKNGVPKGSVLSPILLNIYTNDQPIHDGTRNNLVRKLSNSKWGANASTIRTTALALCYSVAEYAAPVWARSSHAQKPNPELNSACRAVTGCLKPTNVEDLYLLAEVRHPTSGEMYVLEWKRPNRKPMRLTLYMVRTRQREC